ncbi:MAG: heme-degrading domain-containing protein [Vibrio sp.]|uniref:heme-degrading domain-containing protein n=1 Tax=Vibrio sp. TaxID=678 RepID=UPI003A8B81AD
MSYTLESLVEQERELQLKYFNQDVAWQLGCCIKALAEQKGAAISIEVFGFGQTLFQFCMLGSSADQLDWIRRKRNSVLCYGKSTYYLSLYNEGKKREFETQPHIDPNEYCAHGGSFPIRIKGSGLVGAVTASGLASLEDHELVTEALKQALESQKAL